MQQSFFLATKTYGHTLLAFSCGWLTPTVSLFSCSDDSGIHVVSYQLKGQGPLANAEPSF